jgi:hypothetical protein
MSASSSFGVLSYPQFLTLPSLPPPPSPLCPSPLHHPQSSRKASTIRQKGAQKGPLSIVAGPKKWARDSQSSRPPRLRKLQDVLFYELSGVAKANASLKVGGGGGGRSAAVASSSSSSSSSAAVAAAASAAATNAILPSSSSYSSQTIAAMPPYTGSTDASEHYVAAAAGRPQQPARPFCSICGYKGPYSCTRCGARYCSMKCRDTHKDVRCVQSLRGGR